MNIKLTKTEIKLLNHVRIVNDHGYLCGLGISPTDADYARPEYRFVKRLAEKGRIVWVDWNSKLGAGWILVGRKPNAPKEFL